MSAKNRAKSAHSGQTVIPRPPYRSNRWWFGFKQRCRIAVHVRYVMDCFVAVCPWDLGLPRMGRIVTD